MADDDNRKNYRSTIQRKRAMTSNRMNKSLALLAHRLRIHSVYEVKTDTRLRTYIVYHLPIFFLLMFVFALTRTVFGRNSSRQYMYNSCENVTGGQSVGIGFRDASHRGLRTTRIWRTQTKELGYRFSSAAFARQ